MDLDLDKLSTTDRVIVGAGAVAFVAAFLPWWGYSGPLDLYGSSVIGWNAGFTAWAGSLLLTAAAAYLLALRLGVGLPTLPFGPAVTVAAAALLGLVLVVIRWASLPRVEAGLAGDIGPRFGIWLALLAGLVQVVAAVAAFRRSGEELPWQQPSGAT